MRTHLTTAQRDTLALALQARQQALRQQIQARHQGLSEAEQALALREQDGNDSVQLASEREVESTLTDIEQRELQALDQALQRVQEPDYGLCTDCGADIPFERLHIEPQALRCVACASRHEKKEH